MLPYYLLMKLPGEDRPSFLLMQPFTPRGRPNMVSFMVAKSGPLEEYGRIIEYGLPSDSQIDGPGQVGNFINQDPEISAEFTLLGQGGSRVIQGNMLVIPIEQSLLYVQPIYISANDEASSTGIPEFKRVVVSFNGQIEMRDTLNEALAAVFGVSNGGGVDGGDGGPTDPPTGTIEEQVVELLARADQAFMEADEAEGILLDRLEGPARTDTLKLSFNTGKRRKAWNRNCVAIGLSGGFLEPLESTAIYLIQTAVTHLVELMPHSSDCAVERDEFNRIIDNEFLRVRDFLILHYHATERTDSDFWNHVRTMPIPDSLQEKIDLFKARGRVSKYQQGLFLECRKSR